MRLAFTHCPTCLFGSNSSRRPHTTLQTLPPPYRRPRLSRHEHHTHPPSPIPQSSLSMARLRGSTEMKPSAAGANQRSGEATGPPLWIGFLDIGASGVGVFGVGAFGFWMFVLDVFFVFFFLLDMVLDMGRLALGSVALGAFGVWAFGIGYWD
ncbi:hypothetical protein V8C26DRAFT_165652 [Trichoderma gracile]